MTAYLVCIQYIWERVIPVMTMLRLDNMLVIVKELLNLSTRPSV